MLGARLYEQKGLPGLLVGLGWAGCMEEGALTLHDLPPHLLGSHPPGMGRVRNNELCHLRMGMKLFAGLWGSGEGGMESRSRRSLYRISVVRRGPWCTAGGRELA